MSKRTKTRTKSNVFECAVFGYVREHEKKQSISAPAMIKYLILNYYVLEKGFQEHDGSKELMHSAVRAIMTNSMQEVPTQPPSQIPALPLPFAVRMKQTVHDPSEQKLSVKRMDNMLFEQQHKRNHNSNGYDHSNSNMHHIRRGNYRGNCAQRETERRGCQLGFIGKLKKWISVTMESVFGDVGADVRPLGYKKLSAASPYGEVRASIVQRLQETQQCQLIRRQRQDPANDQWMKHERRNQTWYDVVRVANCGYNPTANITTLTFYAVDQHVRLNKTCYPKDPVMLVEECNLNQSKVSNILCFKDIKDYGIVGMVHSVGHPHDPDALIVHIDTESNVFSKPGTLVAMIRMNPLTFLFRELQRYNWLVRGHLSGGGSFEPVVRLSQLLDADLDCSEYIDKFT